jgi:hypothetical protein
MIVHINYKYNVECQYFHDIYITYIDIEYFNKAQYNPTELFEGGRYLMEPKKLCKDNFHGWYDNNLYLNLNIIGYKIMGDSTVIPDELRPPIIKFIRTEKLKNILEV